MAGVVAPGRSGFPVVVGARIWSTMAVGVIAVVVMLVAAGFVLQRIRDRAEPPISGQNPAQTSPLPTVSASQPAVALVSPVAPVNIEPLARPSGSRAVPAPPAMGAASADELTVEQVAGEVSLRLAVVGAPRGITHYLLAEPPGIAINLPRVRTRVAPGMYHPAGGYFKSVWIRRTGAGSQVRVSFDAHVYRPEITVDRDGVRLALRPR